MQIINENYINNDLLPLDVNDSPWLYENNNENIKGNDIGKWMLYYDIALINEAWVFAKKLYRENKLNGVKSMKCSTAYKNPRAYTFDEGIIILFCNNSSNQDTIINIGKKILKEFNYKERRFICYKTNLQTYEGTIATGNKKNHTYKIFNELYRAKCLIKINEINTPLQVEKHKLIERNYPTKKNEIRYPNRYDKSVFEKLNEMNKDVDLQNDYKKWKNGINYKTNRKITIDGKIHEKLKKRFIIYQNNSYNCVLFDKLNSINVDEYLQETEKIFNEIDIENSLIKKYNDAVNSVIEKIQRLKTWDEFIEFEGKFYGITSKVLNNIHIENNCLGEMVFTHKKTEYTFNDRPFCNYDDKETTYAIYKCNKCNYENSIIECSTGGGSQYISKTGFWWK